MHSNTHHSNEDNTSTAAELSRRAPSVPAPNRLARRAFLRNLGMGAALLAPWSYPARQCWQGIGSRNTKEDNALSRGDVAILQLLAAAELIEADLWQQYTELGGVDAPTTGYTAGLQILDGDQPQYISDNTDDERSHATFLNAYLASKASRRST